MNGAQLWFHNDGNNVTILNTFDRIYASARFNSSYHIEIARITVVLRRSYIA